MLIINGKVRSRANGEVRLVASAAPAAGEHRIRLKGEDSSAVAVAASLLGSLIRIVLLTAVSLFCLLGIGRAALADEPVLDWNKRTICSEDAAGDSVRMQCDESTMVCLVAPGQKADGSPLQRITACNAYQPTWQVLVDQGYTMKPASPETPPGWQRDERGRVYQVTFDLLKRFHIGAAWAPRWLLARPNQEDSSKLDRTRFEMGLVASIPVKHDKVRHTFHALEGDVTLDDLSVNGLLLGYDWSHRASQPFLRITTFFGQPERFDLFMDVGFRINLLEVRSERYQEEQASTELNVTEVLGAWDIYQSNDLYDRVRIYAGAGVGMLWSELTGENGLSFVAPETGVEFRAGLDSKGLHYLDANASFTSLLVIPDSPAGNDLRHRAELGAGYEWIFLAINDQPLSLRLEAKGAWRDDLPTEGEFWDLSAVTGLRFSFWAPAREAGRIPFGD